MKNQLVRLSAAALFVLLLSAGHARAQTNNQTLTRIPFDFYVREERFAAGDYYIPSVNPQAGPTATQLRSRDGKTNRIFITTLAELIGAVRGGGPALTFNHYGADHFLAEIRNPGQGFVAKLSKAKCEEALARQFGGQQPLKVRTRPAAVSSDGF